MDHCKSTNSKRDIAPGTVLILVKGPFGGCRVVCLKQLKSGLLLVTGPHQLNKVPLQRVSRRHVIVTSTRIDVGATPFDDCDDGLFATTKKPRSHKFIPDKTMEVEPADNPRLTALQEQVDRLVISAIRRIPLMAEYLEARFSLKKGQAPHKLRF